MREIFRLVFACTLLAVMMICSCASPSTITSPSSTAPTPAQTPIPPPTPAPPPKPQPAPKEVELKYDDGEGNILSQTFATTIAVRKNGYIIDFLPTAKPFTIKKIKLYGTVKLCPI